MKGSGEVWDLVVGGGGPAGFALAAKAALKGLRVLVLEKESSPGEGHSWVVDVEKTVFEEADIPSPGKGARWVEPERQVMTSLDGSTEIEIEGSPVVPVKNREYVSQLASWAEEAGAQVRFGCSVTGPLVSGDFVTGVRFKYREKGEESVKARVVADCTGYRGAVRRGTPGDWGLSRDIEPIDRVLARREVREVDTKAAELAVEAGVIRDRVRVDRTGVMAAYSVESYYMDAKEGFIDILVGGKLGGRFPTADEWFQRILEKWPFVGGKVFGDGGPIPVRRTWESLVGNGFLVLGDSACQVIPIHGSGTASALLAADMAAAAVAEALERERYDRGALWRYCHGFQSGRGSILAYYFAIQRYTGKLSGEQVDRLISNGLTTSKDVYDGLVPRPLSFGPAEMADKLLRGASSLPLLVELAWSGLKAQRMERHYRRYPSEYDPSSLEDWIENIPRVNDRIRS